MLLIKVCCAVILTSDLGYTCSPFLITLKINYIWLQSKL